MLAIETVTGPFPGCCCCCCQVNNVSVRYERAGGGESDNDIYSQGEVVPADKIVEASGFKVGGTDVNLKKGLVGFMAQSSGL